MSLLRVEGLGHDYAGRTVLRQIDLRLEPGQRAVVRGSTGAGKSTLALLVVGLLRVQRGAVRLQGRPSRDHRARTGLGYLPQEVRVPWGLRVGEWLRLSGSCWGTPATAIARAVEELELLPLLQRRARDLSGGQLRLCALALALAEGRRLLVLDEPLTGLDEQWVARVGEVLDQGLALGGAQLVLCHGWPHSAHLCLDLRRGVLHTAVGSP